jgi:hypothetical protein
MRRAQERAGGAELVRIAEALRRHRRDARGLRLLDRDVLVLGDALHVRLEPVGREAARQQEVDGDVVRRTWRATPQRNAVRPARAPDERSSPPIGIFTEPDVMLTMRPNFLAFIAGTTFWISSIATTMLPVTPSIIFCRSSSMKSRNGGPALLFTRMSGSGMAANSAACPCGVAMSATTGITLAPVALAISPRSPRSAPCRAR